MCVCERDGQRKKIGKEKGRDRDRDRHSERQGETERERHRKTETEGDRDKERLQVLLNSTTIQTVYKNQEHQVLGPEELNRPLYTRQLIDRRAKIPLMPTHSLLLEI